MRNRYLKIEDEREDEKHFTSQSELLTKQQSQLRPNYRTKSRFSSVMGAVTHSIQWLNGRSTDTVLVNPFYKASPAKPAYHLYCVHGTADRSYAFHTMATRLLASLPDDPSRNMLPENIATIHLLAFDGRGRGNDIAFYSDQLKSKMIKNGHKDVVIIGHSRGGLVGADFTENKANDTGVNVHGVISYCAPFNGSPWSVRPFTHWWASVKDMKKGSHFLTKLRPAIVKNNTESKKYYYFGVEKDLIVPAENTYITAEGETHSVTLLPGHGHLSILRSKAVCGYTSDILHQISNRPVVLNPAKLSVLDAYREVDAEIITFKNRQHLNNKNDKLRVLTQLRDELKSLHVGNRDDLLPEAMTVSQYIEYFFSSVDIGTNRPRREILQRGLNKPISFFQYAPPKSQQLIDKLVETYADVPLPPKLELLAQPSQAFRM